MPNQSLIPEGVRPAVKDKCADVIAGTGDLVRNVWGYAGWPDHNTRRCIDFMIRNDAGGDRVAEYLIDNAERLGVIGIIWNGRVMGFPANGDALDGVQDNDSPYRGPAGRWRDYDGEDQHTDHVHAEFDAEPIKGQAPNPGKGNAGKGYRRPASGEVYLDKLRPGVKNSDSVYYWQLALNAIKLRGGSELRLDGDYGPKVEHETKLFQAQRCRDRQDGWPGPKQAAYAFQLARRELRAKGVDHLVIYRDSDAGGLVDRVW